jgi:protease-4
MKKGTYVLIIFLVLFVLFLATVASLFYFSFGKPPKVKAQSYLEIQLYGQIAEKTTPDFFSTLFTGRQSLSMFDIWTNIRKAKVDQRIKALVLRLGFLQCDWGKVNEIREAVIEFKKSGKKVYAYLDEAIDIDKEYYLATACDKIVLQPAGTLIINGIGGDIPFLKNTLDKLGIEAEIEHVEKYKTAYHMFTKEGFTPAHKEMMESIYGDIFNQYINTVAKAREKDVSEIRNLIDIGYFHADKALEAGLVDALLFDDEFIDLIRGDRKKMTRISHKTYLKIKPSSVGLDSGKKIALIYGLGAIHTGEGSFQSMGSSTVVRWLRKVRKDKSIVAVVLRIDSPGGSVVASDTIWREVFLTKKQKPVVVSMSDMAGSGGYWISMCAHKIFAHPQTLTGSIGVIFGKFNMIRLYEKIGITSEKIKFGKRADIFSSFRKFTPEERQFLKKEILWAYDQFLTKVAEGRNMTRADVDKIGKGRVWTGNQAMEIGLVDELGGLSNAIIGAKELAGMARNEIVKLVVYPKDYSFLDVFLGAMTARTKLKVLSRWEKMLSIFELLQNERRWALMPIWLTPN